MKLTNTQIDNLILYIKNIVISLIYTVLMFMELDLNIDYMQIQI